MYVDTGSPVVIHGAEHVRQRNVKYVIAAPRGKARLHD